MRIKNKELRQRRHRKEQIIKAANKAIAAQYADKKSEPKPKAAPKPTAARAKAEPKPKAKKESAE